MKKRSTSLFPASLLTSMLIVKGLSLILWVLRAYFAIFGKFFLHGCCLAASTLQTAGDFWVRQHLLHVFVNLSTADKAHYCASSLVTFRVSVFSFCLNKEVTEGHVLRSSVHSLCLEATCLLQSSHPAHHSQCWSSSQVWSDRLHLLHSFSTGQTV